MLKKSLFFVLFIFNLSFSMAQDVIIKKNGDEIKAKVLEINSTEIKFKNIDNPTGPMYTVSKSEIFMIKYENGMKEVIGALDTPPPAPVNNYQQQYTYVPQAPPAPQKIEQIDDKFYQSGIRLSNNRLYRLLRECPDARTRNLGIEAEKPIKAARPLIVLSIPFMAAGFGVGILTSLLIASYDNSSSSSSGSSSYSSTVNFLRVPQVVGFTMAGIGAGSLIAGITLNSIGTKKMMLAVDSYNQTIK